MASKKESSLLKTVEAQKEQLSRYETKMKDLVRAYKSLNKEKEALQASVHVMSQKRPAKADPEASATDTENDTGQTTQLDGGGMQAQLETVTASLQTLVLEKSRMEANFMSDRKSLRLELDKTQSELNAGRRELTETRANLLQSQRDRESEVTNYNQILREVQQLLCTERETSTRSREIAADLESRLTQQSASTATSRQLQLSVTSWHQRAEELQQTVLEREGRVSLLENDVTELSASLGHYQQQSAEDQSALSRLKERLVRMEDERRSLTCSTVPDIAAGPEDMRQLADAIRLMLQKQNESEAELLAPIREIMKEVDEADWKEEYKQLKEEFEKYKVRFMAARRKDPSLSSAPALNTELDGLRRQVEDLRSRLKRTCEERDDAERALKLQISQLEQTAGDVRLAERSERAALLAAHRQQLSELEQQLAGQRQRTAALLQERDEELAELRRLPGCGDPVTPSLEHISFTTQETHILHYVQEAARKDVEISGLRRAKNQLEMSLRQLQSKLLDREQLLLDQVDFLNEKIHRLEMNVSREGANLEYIKNIVYGYLVTTEPTQRAHILNAIATALRFNSAELSRVRQGHTAAWWPSAALPW